ncbi:hypothetical protein CL55_00003210 [Polynucleobacter duraquae]|uniref:Spore protein YkvP/CgeB glycosyl transferase-like domain-containing protein n=1 Tax=Polynucleobacter duraquae TaxID=1835254 RepID=A0A0E3UZT1_9BURK|nr:glycosyltransferase [Polynucleobacter duraquae]AKD24654.1 hypothetical protein CL55_00003210 [Polynucleobacter duraquae]
MEQIIANNGLRVIFIGDLNAYTRSAWRAMALKSCVKTLRLISHTAVQKNGSIYKLSFLEKIFTKLRIKYDNMGLDREILSLNLKSFDLIWVDSTLNISGATIAKVKKSNINLKILYFSEDDFLKKHNSKIGFLKNLKTYDYIVTTKKRNLASLSQRYKRVILVADTYSRYLLNKAQKLLPHIFTKHSYLYDVSFVGAYELERSESLIFLAQNEIVVNVWGNGWSALNNAHKNLIIHNKHLREEKLIEVIRTSKINLNFLRKKNNDQITSRSIEIPSSGGFMLAEKTEEHLALISKTEAEIEAVLFADNSDLLRKINFYLINHAVREQIRLAGEAKFTNEKYSIEAIVSNILKEINDDRNKISK